MYLFNQNDIFDVNEFCVMTSNPLSYGLRPRTFTPFSAEMWLLQADAIFQLSNVDKDEDKILLALSWLELDVLCAIDAEKFLKNGKKEKEKEEEKEKKPYEALRNRVMAVSAFYCRATNSYRHISTLPIRDDLVI